MAGGKVVLMVLLVILVLVLVILVLVLVMELKLSVTLVTLVTLVITIRVGGLNLLRSVSKESECEVLKKITEKIFGQHDGFWFSKKKVKRHLEAVDLSEKRV